MFDVFTFHCSSPALDVLMLSCDLVSCYAGETLHFYEEVYEHGKIPEGDSIRRIYMARHIMEKFIVAGLVSNIHLLSS